TLTIGAVTGGLAPYTYSVDGSAFTATTNYTGLAAGTHTVAVTDANGCVFTAPNATITSSGGATAVAVTTTPATCAANNGTLTIGAVTGGLAPYTYSVDGSAFTATTNYTGLTAGNHTVSVTDANGCIFTAPNATITSSGGATAVAVTTTNATCGNPTGTLTIGAVTGGLAPYTYSVDGSAFTATTNYTGLAAGTHTVAVTDANGCIFTAPNATITSSGGATAVAVTTTPATCAANNGTLTIGAVTGGTAPYTYSVDGSAFTATTNYTGLAAGTHTVAVTDANGCVFTAPNATITSSGGATAVVLTSTDATCGQNNGTLTIGVVTGGVAPYSYSINNSGFTTTLVYNNLAPGVYIITVKDANGCSFTATGVTINNNGTSATATFAAIGPFCQGSTAPALPATSIEGIAGTWSPSTISTTTVGTSAYTFTPTSGCSAPVSINITVGGAVTSAVTITICPNQVPYTWNGQQLSTSGTYAATIPSQTGCDSTITLTLDINPTLTSTTNLTLCSTQLPYSWNSQTINAGGTYSTTLQSQGGCDSIAVLNLTVNTTLISTTNVTICTGQLPYTWNNQQFAAAGRYNVNVTSQAGCDSIATLILAVTAPATSTTNLTVCPAQVPYIWNGQQLSVPGTYTATIPTAAGCDSIATLIFDVNSQLTSTTNISVCPNQLPYSWNNQSLPAAGTYTAHLTSQGGCDSTATLNLSVSNVLTSTTNVTVCSATLPYTWNGTPYAAAGTYTATFTSGGGCDSVATLILVVDSNFVGVRYPTVTATPNVATQLLARVFGNNYTYSWTPNIGLDQYTVYNPVFTYDQQTQYLINITSPFGCTTTDTLLVQLNTPTQLVSGLFVPKAWTPNGDGVNDRLYPLTENIKTLNYFRVFNRWGQLMFETNIIGNGWDGVFNGKPQISDVYTWTAEAIGYDGHIYQQAGNSVLLR
ncbi:MAG TPA: T9SS type B sorting domain-containing protein, partial [Puia sp.]|nr:T9SS type B sorting domain-containing protein [Puia sp.]